MKIKDCKEMRKRILGIEYGRCEICGASGGLYHGLCIHCLKRIHRLKQMEALYEENS